MQHNISLEELGAQGPAMAEAVDKCVHCGFCLATCPTYQVLGEEMDSPRGRIYLMKGHLEGTLDLDSVTPYIDRCLGCMACVTACPSGVEYSELLAPFRELAEATRERTVEERFTRFLVRETLPYPGRFRAAAQMGKLAAPFKPLLPLSLRSMLDLLPESLPKAKPIPDFYLAKAPRRARVALLRGCVQTVLAPEINWATLRVLAENGVEVVIPPNQGCCGSLSMHTGEAAQARQLARANLDLFPDDVDAILTNAAGCGSGMHEYGLLFAGLPEEEKAQAFAERVCDVSVFLDKLGINTPPPLPKAITVAYHDACHLAHAQKVTSEPRRLLAAIPNLTLTEIPDAELCCGSAGTYNLEQPTLAKELGVRKAENILTTPAEAVVTGNIGCMTQIENHLRSQGMPLPVWHTMQLLDLAYQSQSQSS